MTPIDKDITLHMPLPVLPLLPHLQEILERELKETEQKTQQVFIPTIGGKWMVKK